MSSPRLSLFLPHDFLTALRPGESNFERHSEKRQGLIKENAKISLCGGVEDSARKQVTSPVALRPGENALERIGREELRVNRKIRRRYQFLYSQPKLQYYITLQRLTSL